MNKPRWAKKKLYQNQWIWSSKELNFIKKNPKFTIRKLAKILKRTESAIRIRRYILGIKSKIPRWTLKEVQKRNSRVINLRSGFRKNGGSSLSLVSCPINTVSCSARSPRWVQTSWAIKGGGRCLSCTHSRGGTLTDEGYRRVVINKKQVLEHRHVMEEVLGRKLFSDETVHHGPGGRADNRPENLELRAPGRHKQGWSIKEMRAYLLTIPKKLGGLR